VDPTLISALAGLPLGTPSGGKNFDTSTSSGSLPGQTFVWEKSGVTANSAFGGFFDVPQMPPGSTLQLPVTLYVDGVGAVDTTFTVSY
jgi:hypothetical protein